MGSVLFLLILIIITTVALTVPLKFRVKANFDSSKCVNVFFLYPFLKIKAEWDGGAMPVLRIYLFKNRIFKKQLKMRRRPNKHPMLWLKSAVILNRKADVSFGLKNPFSTGMASGVFGALSAFLKLEEASIRPDFFSGEDYLRIDARAEILLGNTISNFVKNKRKSKWRNNIWSKA